MEGMEIQNANPLIFAVSKKVVVDTKLGDFEEADDDLREAVTREEVFEFIRHLNDPEHPLSLEQLNVVCAEHVTVDEATNKVKVQFTPTIPHCSMATLIGLCIRVKLLRSLHPRFKVTVEIYPGSHQSEVAINKQLNDKERVAAAIENGHLLDVVNKCITDTDKY